MQIRCSSPTAGRRFLGISRYYETIFRTKASASDPPLFRFVTVSLSERSDETFRFIVCHSERSEESAPTLHITHSTFNSYGLSFRGQRRTLRLDLPLPLHFNLRNLETSSVSSVSSVVKRFALSRNEKLGTRNPPQFPHNLLCRLARFLMMVWRKRYRSHSRVTAAAVALADRRQVHHLFIRSRRPRVRPD